MLSKGVYLNAYAHVLKGATSTCVVGGRLIDYFLTPVAEVGSVQECTKIVQSRIRPHDPVRLRLDRRPHLTKVLAPGQAKELLEKVPVGPMFQTPSWNQSKAKSKEWGWAYPKFSTMNPTQELYLNEIGVRDTAVDLGNKCCEWSAAVTVQNITQHYQRDKDIKSHLGMGQPLAFSYQGRPKRTPQDNHRNKTTGFVTEALKLTIRAKKAKLREGTTEEAQQLVDLVRDQDRIQDEMSRLLEGDTPKHQDLGLTSDRWARTLSGLKFHRNMALPGLQQLQSTLQASIGHVQTLEGKEKASAIEL